MAVSRSRADRALWLARRPVLAAALAARGRRAVYAVAFGPGGDVLAAACGNGWVYLWDVASRGLAGAFAGPGSRGVNGVVFSPAGDVLAAADGNGCTYLWKLGTQPT